ncbi:TRAP transporter small permease subunit [Salipiger marinus]|uniref:TRAP transporter small permease subunit n=1 Tax=Salipiger marinus TaxID=555512 RepID=UPI004058BAD6
MPQENRVAQALTPAARALALLAGYALLLLTLVITVEVLLRRFANISLQGSDELGGYTLAMIGAFGFSLAALERAHTRVEILTEHAGPGTGSVLNLLATLGTMLMALFMAWQGWVALMESVEFRSLSGTPLMTPLWMPQGVWVFGLAVFALVSTALFLHAALLFARDRDRLNRFYGPKALKEVIDEEQAGMTARGAR